MPAVRRHGKFIVSLVAYGDHRGAAQFPAADDPGSIVCDIHSERIGSSNRHGMHPFGGLGTGAVCSTAGELGPQRSSKLRARRVGGAHEEGCGRCDRPTGEDAVEGIPANADVPAAAVAARPGPVDEARSFEHVEVVGEEIGGDPEAPVEFGRSAVREGEVIGDSETAGVGEGGEPGDPGCEFRAGTGARGE